MCVTVMDVRPVAMNMDQLLMGMGVFVGRPLRFFRVMGVAVMLIVYMSMPMEKRLMCMEMTVSLPAENQYSGNHHCSRVPEG